MMSGYMVDTMIFNDIADGTISPDQFPMPIYTTHIQLDELLATKEPRKQLLLNKFISLKPNVVATQTFVCSISACGGAAVGSGDLYHSILNKLNDLNSFHKNNAKDALIAEASILNDFIFITREKKLLEAVVFCGGKAMTAEEMIFIGTKKNASN